MDLAIFYNSTLKIYLFPLTRPCFTGMGWSVVVFLTSQIGYPLKLIIPPANFVCGGYTVFTLSLRVCVRPCMRPSDRNVLFP